MIVITIPAYNEEDQIGQTLKDIDEVMLNSKEKYLIQVIDDGSTDRTAEIAEKYATIVKKHPRNLGLAETFRSEMYYALKQDPEIIVHTDADGQYKAAEIPKLIKKVREGYDLVLGSRFAGTIESMPWLKKFGNKAFSKVLSNISKEKITDGQTGFRAFTPEVAKLPLRSSHTYTQEQILRVAKNKFKIIEVPIYFAKRYGDSSSRLIKNPLEYAAKAWLNILRTYRDHEPLKFFGSIGLVLAGVGFLLSTQIIYIFLFQGFNLVKTKTPTIILIAMLMLSGLQVLLFGFLADQRSEK